MQRSSLIQNLVPSELYFSRYDWLNLCHSKTMNPCSLNPTNYCVKSNLTVRSDPHLVQKPSLSWVFLKQANWTKTTLISCRNEEPFITTVSNSSYLSLVKYKVKNWLRKHEWHWPGTRCKCLVVVNPWTAWKPSAAV